MNDSPKSPMQEIWQCQPVEGLKISVEEIHHRAEKFEKKIMWRNVREHLSGLVAAVLFGSFFVKSHDPLFRTACGLLIAGLAYVAWQLYRKGSSRNLPEHLGSESSLQFYRKQLEQQRDLAASVWSWYLAPLVPGLVLFAVSSALADPRPRKLAALALYYGFCVALFIFIRQLHTRGARCLQRLIDELYAAERPSSQEL